VWPRAERTIPATWVAAAFLLQTDALRIGTSVTTDIHSDMPFSSPSLRRGVSLCAGIKGDHAADPIRSCTKEKSWCAIAAK
jgi:hypothetical protein